jgi:2-polyprenyl-6-methoxyphenol hydroxylase-like FAD-dependent oxidoreductase
MQMLMAALRVLVVGAGIAGLAVHRALAARGLATEVVERGARPPVTGSGLYLPANAVLALSNLGVTLAGRAAAIGRQEVRDHRGRLLVGYDVGLLWGDAGDCRAIARTDLHGILLAGAAVRFGAGVAEAGADGTVTFADGTRETYDVVVGADGIDSAIRRTAFPGRTPRFLGRVCWRFLTGAALPEGTWTVRLGRGGRSFLTVPLGDGRVHCYADIASSSPLPPVNDWRPEWADFADPVPELLDRAGAADFAALHEVGGDDWVRDHAVLIGDAAHACSPSMAQGVAMALEDALVLAELLTSTRSRDAVPAVLQAYRRRRAGRIAFVLARNRRRDRTRSLPAGLRNLVLRRAGRRLLRADHAGLHGSP